MRHGQSRILAFALCLGCITATEAAAQTPAPLQVGVGYQLVHVSFDGSAEVVPLSFYADVRRGITADSKKAWGWVGQFDGGFRDADGTRERVYTMLGGISIASTKPWKWTPSGHGLIGVGVSDVACSESCADAPGIGSGIRTTQSGVAFGGDAGLTRRVNNRISVNVAFRATKIKLSNGTRFNAAASGGVRIDLRRAP